LDEDIPINQVVADVATNSIPIQEQEDNEPELLIRPLITEWQALDALYIIMEHKEQNSARKGG